MIERLFRFAIARVFGPGCAYCDRAAAAIAEAIADQDGVR